MNTGVEAKWRSYPPFYAWLGAQLERLQDGECIVRLDPRAELGNSKGDLHGGAIAALLDITLSQAVRSAYSEVVNVSTISMTINYLAPTVGVARASGKVLRAGASIAYAEGEAVNQQGEVVSRISATYRIIRAKA